MALKFRAMQGSYAIILQLTKIFVSFIRRNWQPARYYVAERERERENLAAETLNHSQSGTSQRDREVSCAHRVSLQSVRHFVERQRSLLRTPCFIIASSVLCREAEKFVAHILLHYSQFGTMQRDREICCAHLVSLQSVRHFVERQRSLLRTPCFIIASSVLCRETEKFVAHILLHYSQSGTSQREREVRYAHLASLQPVGYFVERQRSLLRTPCFILASPVLRRETEKFFCVHLASLQPVRYSVERQRSFFAHTSLHYSQSGTPQRDREVCCAHLTSHYHMTEICCTVLASLQAIRYSAMRQRNLLRRA